LLEDSVFDSYGGELNSDFYDGWPG
jgi:hypothetical protein